MLFSGLAAAAVGFVFREEAVRRLQRVVGICLLWNLFFSVIAAFWDSGAGMYLRNRMASLRAFQVNRLMWIAPALWYLAFACGGMIWLELLRCRKGWNNRSTGWSA